MNPENSNDLTKLDMVLDECLNLLGEAVQLIEALEPDPKSAALKQITATIGSILYTKTFIPQDARIEPDEIPIPDGPLTDEEQKRVSQLTEDEIQWIDDALLRNVSAQWRKVARVVGSAMLEESNQIRGIVDLYYVQRLRRLVEKGLLESQGNLDFMRFSEVRLPKPLN